MAIIPTTELDAVNAILTNLGEPPVNSLTGEIPLDASQALAALNEVSREVQKRGWYFNTEDHIVAPDVSGYLNLPLNCLQAKTIDEDKCTPVVQRNTRLYNMTPFKHGFVFDKSLKCQLVLGLSYTDLPQTAKSYVFLRAARVFQVRQLGDQMNSQDDTTDEKMALVELHAEQLRMAPYSLRDSASMSAALSQIPTISI